MMHIRPDSRQTYRRLYGPYTVEVIHGVAVVWRHSWRTFDQEYDWDRNLREIKFPGAFKPERLPQ